MRTGGDGARADVVQAVDDHDLVMGQMRPETGNSASVPDEVIAYIIRPATPSGTHMRPILFTLAMTIRLCVGFSPAMAQPAHSQCFSIRDFHSWKALDAKTLYIRVDTRRYFRLDLETSCPLLLSQNSHLITKWRGSSWVCSPTDWNLSVSDDPVRGFASPCIVRKMTALTDSEAAAIPRKNKP
jgi:hypothetical protein